MRNKTVLEDIKRNSDLQREILTSVLGYQLRSIHRDLIETKAKVEKLERILEEKEKVNE